MPTPGVLRAARGRGAKINALNTAFTDGPGDREEQAKDDLAVEFSSELGEALGVAYTR